MKKIVALVLSLVMALSLCTVAFAAEYPYSVFNKGANTGDPIQHAKYVEQTKTMLGYYLCENDVVLVETATENYTHVINVDGKDVNVMYVGAMPEAVTVEAVTAHSWVGCGDEEDQIPADCYVDADGVYYVKDKNGDVTLTVDGKYDNTFKAHKALVFTKGAEQVKANYEVVPASHILVLVEKNIDYKTSTGKSVKDVNEYKCYFCGKTFYGSNYDYSTPETAVDYDKDYAKHLVKYEFVKLGATTELADVNYVWTSDVATGTKTEGVSSAKTFDAGIAMYVGMSLMSVAGGAVVIGKKKEF